MSANHVTCTWVTLHVFTKDLHTRGENHKHEAGWCTPCSRRKCIFTVSQLRPYSKSLASHLPNILYAPINDTPTSWARTPSLGLACDVLCLECTTLCSSLVSAPYHSIHNPLVWTPNWLHHPRDRQKYEVAIEYRIPGYKRAWELGDHQIYEALIERNAWDNNFIQWRVSVRRGCNCGIFFVSHN